MEIVTRREPRRSWTLSEKRQIVAESFGPELTPTEVARKHAISSGQLYTWRQQVLGAGTTLVQRAGPSFAQVELEAAASVPTDAPPPSPAPPSSVALLPARPEGLIEVVLPGGTVLRLDAHVDARALRRVLGVLEGR